MEVIEPKVEIWEQTEDTFAHVARCAAVCYDSKKYNADKMCLKLINNGHKSMFRHQSRYYIIPIESNVGSVVENYNMLCHYFGDNPYMAIYRGIESFYISTNGQYIMEHPDVADNFRDYEVEPHSFLTRCPDKSLYRLTICIDTSIKVSRELNRTSPNNIAEQSTRYVNMLSKKGDIPICASVEDESLTAADLAIIRQQESDCVETYKRFIESGLKPETARRVLPLDTATRVVYTYTLKEWNHILELRYFETTGKAAPDAKKIGELIYFAINKYLNV